MYEVEWLPTARQHFAAAWRPLEEAGRQELMRIVESLDERLRDDPEAIGESRESDFTRMAWESPVAISFQIDPRLKLVRVFAVHVYRQR